MKLYSIRHKLTNKFYNGYGTFSFRGELGNQARWANTPSVFWKTPDGVLNGLKRLGSQMVKPAARPEGMNHHEYCEYLKRVHVIAHRFRCWDNFDIERLSDIEIIVTDVSVRGEAAYSAASFFSGHFDFEDI